MLLAPQNDGVLNAAFLQVIQDLFAGDLVRTGDTFGLGEIVRVEVADPPRKDFPRSEELIEGGDRFFQRMPPAPMQKLAVEPVGFQTDQRPFTRR